LGPPGPISMGMEDLATTGIRSPDRSARSESLYRFSDKTVKNVLCKVHQFLYQILKQMFPVT